MDASEKSEKARREKMAGTKLYRATFLFNMTHLAEAIAEGAPVSGLNFYNRGMEMSPLMTAASFANVEACRALLAAGAKLDERDIGGSCARIYAACDANPETLKALMGEAPLDPQLAQALLFAACSGGNVENARLMIASGADPTAKLDGLDAMMRSADFGELDCAILALAAGCDPTARSPEGLTAVELCRESGHHEEADALASAILAVQESEEIKELLGTCEAPTIAKAYSGL